MKNFFLKTGLTLLCLIIGLGSAWGETYSFTPDKATTGNSATAYVTSAYSFTYNNIGWSFNQWNPSTLQIKTNQSSAGSEFNFKNTSAFPGKITSVVITFKALTVSDASKLHFVGGSSAISSLSGGTSGTWNSTDKTLTWKPASTDYTYFAFYQNGKAASGTNYLAEANAIVVTYESSTPAKTLSSIAVKTAPSKTTYTEGENFDPTGLVITGTYSDTSTEDIAYADHASDFNFSPDLTTALATSDTSVTITYGSKTTTQSITVEEAPKHTAYFYSNGSLYRSEQYAEGEAITFPSGLADINGKNFVGWVASTIVGTTNTTPDFVVSATMGTSDVTYYAVFATQTGSGTTSYEKLTSNSFDNSATYVLAANESSSTNTLHYFSTYTTTTANESWGVTSTDPADAIKFTLSGSASALKAMDASGAYIQALATGKFRMSGSVQTLNLNNDGTISNPTSGSTGYNLRYNHNNGSGGFRWYNSTTGTSAYFYKVVAGATYSDYCTTVGEPTPATTLTGITVTGTPAEFWKGDDFNHDGITVTANYDDSSSEDVTSSAEFSGYDMNTAGEQTVTVTYQEKTATYNINVKTIANTQATAYTVAQAKELIDAGKDLSTEVYVAGKISQVDSYNSTYNSITYWISADGTTTDQFEVYGGLAQEGETFTSKDDVQVGAEVIVYGVIKKFNSIYEFDLNSNLVSYSYTPPTTDFIKKPEATVKVLDPISIKDYINGEYSSYEISTTIDGKTQKDYEFVCIYDHIRFCKGGEYVVDVTGTSGSDTKTGKVTFTVTPSDAELSSVTIGGTLTKTTYTVGDEFDFAGLTLTATCSDNSTADVTSEAEWVANPATITEGTTKVTVTATYCGMTDTKEYDVTVNADYATLPFEWAGGVSANFTALNGVTASGLGTDYADTHAPYRIKLDNTEDYFQVKTNEAIGICTVGVKMIGGATASSIKVQGSADGESFTDVETLTISGKQNDVLSLSTTSNLDESYRYVRFVFTKGSNVGVGPITIAKPDNTPTYTVTVASDIEHGTVTTSADKAKENDEITVTVNPDTHYHLASLYYTEEGDATQHLITATDDVYSFTMPAANVTVSATFEEDAKYTVTIETPTNGTLVVKHGDDVVTSGEQFAVGEVLDITATPAAGYKFRNWQAVDGTTHTFTSGTKWTMTASDVTIKANFDPADQNYLISWNVNGTVTNQQVDANSALVAPDMTDKTLGTREFVGWTEDALVKNDTIPTYVTLGNATKDVTYYAVFADREEVTAAVPTSITAYADGNYYLVDKFVVEGVTRYYALDGAVNSAGSIIPTDITDAVTLNDGRITIDETNPVIKDAMKYNLANINDEYVLTHLLSGKVIGKGQGEKDNNLSSADSHVNWYHFNANPNDPNTFSLNTTTVEEKEESHALFMQYSTWDSKKQVQVPLPRFRAYAVSNRGAQQEKNAFYSAGYTYFVPATPIALSNFATHEVSVSQYGSTTLCMPEDYVMPEGLTGKIVTANEAVDSKGDGYYTLTFQTKYTAGDVVPAGECLVLSGNQGSYYIAPGETKQTVSDDNLLHGDYVIDTEDSKLRFITTYDEENASSNYYYKLATNKDKENFGWYWGNTTGEPFLMTSNERAYLVIDKGTAALIRGFALDEFGEEDITTFIEGLTNEEINKSGRIYNLQGQMVNKFQKGINIVNGKKVIR